MTVPIDELLVALRAAFAPSPLDAKDAFAWESDAELCERAAGTLRLVIERHPGWADEARVALERYWAAFA